jgi:hypothetical protein
VMVKDSGDPLHMVSLNILLLSFSMYAWLLIQWIHSDYLTFNYTNKLIRPIFNRYCNIIHHTVLTVCLVGGIYMVKRERTVAPGPSSKKKCLRNYVSGKSVKHKAGTHILSFSTWIYLRCFLCFLPMPPPLSSLCSLLPSSLGCKGCKGVRGCMRCRHLHHTPHISCVASHLNLSDVLLVRLSLHSLHAS